MRAGAPMMRALCRACLRDHLVEALPPRCPACGAPGLLSHPERDTLTLAHVDCDAFYAAVEKRDNPALADKPVIIGGGHRGVVSTACYIARTYGVRSAMPMFKALAACPEAVVLRPDMEKYARVGREVRILMQELTPLVEPISIDEAFMDLAGTEKLHQASPAITLAHFALRVEREIGITISVGLSYVKFLAKMASDLKKPRGFQIIGRAEAIAFLKDRPIQALPGIGQVSADRLKSAGLVRIGDLAGHDLKRLGALVGRDAPRLRDLALGIDPRRVTPEHDTKSVSAETTLNQDLSRYDALEPHLWRLCEKTSKRLKAKALAGKTVTLKLKTADFRLITRSQQLPEPTQLAARLFGVGKDMLAACCTGESYRLIGIGASELSAAEDADHGDLADPDIGRIKAVESAVDTLRARFGDAIVGKGIGLGAATSRKPSRDRDRGG